MTAFLWRATRGYRLRPWCSPYLRWRIETYWGIPAETIGFRDFWKFLWRHRAEILRFLRWAGRMRKLAGPRASRAWYYRSFDAGTTHQLEDIDAPVHRHARDFCSPVRSRHPDRSNRDEGKGA